MPPAAPVMTTVAPLKSRSPCVLTMPPPRDRALESPAQLEQGVPERGRHRHAHRAAAQPCACLGVARERDLPTRRTRARASTPSHNRPTARDEAIGGACGRRVEREQKKLWGVSRRPRPRPPEAAAEQLGDDAEA